MASHNVNIVLRSDKTGSGFADTLKDIGATKRATTDLIINVKKIGNVFGELGSQLGGLFQNILKGSVWGTAAEGVKLVAGKIKDLWNASDEAAKKSAEEAAKATDARIAALDKYVSAVKAAKSEADKATNNTLKSIKDEIDATHALTKAKLELQKAEARARGDSAAVAEADSQIAAASAQSEEAKHKAELEAAQKKINSAYVAANMSNIALTGARADLKKRIREIRSAAEESTTKTVAVQESGVAGLVGSGMTLQRVRASDEERKAAADAAEKDFRESEEFKKMHEKYLDLADAAREAAQAEEDARRQRELLIERKKAADVKAAAEVKNAEADAAEKAAEKERAAEVAAAKAAAAERDRLDRELHQKRMADLRAEIDAQKSAHSGQAAVAAAAQSEFERAFAMYRDPTRAAAEIGEEKDREKDLDRLHRDARRYGGKFRIDELAQLMAGGDTEGVRDTLAKYRKSSSFTPEVEAMVRASAAEKTRDLANERMQKIADKVAELTETQKGAAEAVKNLSSHTAEIEKNTAGLAQKVEELLSVKG